jgi:hypothetical protein
MTTLSRLVSKISGVTRCKSFTVRTRSIWVSDLISNRRGRHRSSQSNSGSRLPDDSFVLLARFYGFVLVVLR